MEKCKIKIKKIHQNHRIHIKNILNPNHPQKTSNNQTKTIPNNHQNKKSPTNKKKVIKKLQNQKNKNKLPQIHPKARPKTSEKSSNKKKDFKPSQKNPIQANQQNLKSNPNNIIIKNKYTNSNIQYTIKEKIGKGENASVYLLEEAESNEKYAIKRFKLKNLEHQRKLSNFKVRIIRMK